MEFRNGTVIKGRDLKDCVLCKILKEDMNMRDFQYRLGLNEDVNPLSLSGDCAPGLYFILISNALDFMFLGTQLAVVTIPDEEDVYVSNKGFRTHKLIIEKVMQLNQVDTWKFLVKNGVDITQKENYALIRAAKNGYLEIVKYLHQHGVDITANDNNAIKRAAYFGHYEIVKYLHESGVDIRAEDDEALKCAARNGHLKIVKYLHKNGANITANDNEAFIWAAVHGHLEVVQYLHQNGVDIDSYPANQAIYYAAENGCVKVVKYLYDNAN